MSNTSTKISPAERLRGILPDVEIAALGANHRGDRGAEVRRKAAILAHNYMTPDIFHGVSDLRGDSLALARMAAETDAEVIVMAGVHFMAETAKIVNEEKTVLIPDLERAALWPMPSPARTSACSGSATPACPWSPM